MRVWRLIVLALFATIPLAGAAVSAQSDEPTALTVAASGLTNPYGFAFDGDGNLIVAESGIGGDQPAPEDVPAPRGPYLAGPTGQLSRIDDGCPMPLAPGLASARGAAGQTLGPADVAVIDDQIYLLQSAGGSTHTKSEQPAGIYALTGDELVLLADLGGWLRANPVIAPPTEGLDPDGEWIAMVADPASDSLVVVERNHEQVVRVGLDGAISRVADLSADDQVPSALAIAADGTIYVGNLSPEPYVAGAASVIRIDADSGSERVWSGLTLVTGLAIDQQGTLYASELSAGRERPPIIQPGTGRIVRQTGPNTSEELVTQLHLPTAIRFGPDDALYVSLPLIGSDSGTGQVLRADLTGVLPLRAEDADLGTVTCDGAGQTVMVTVSDLGFDPASLTVEVGATVTWRNTGEFDHAVTAGVDSPLQWDSGSLRPGEEFTLTFDKPGSYRYFDGLFPDHAGAIEVVAP